MQRHLTPSALLPTLVLALGLAAILVLALSPAGTPDAWATPPDGAEAANKALVRDYYETVLNGGDFAALDRFVAPGSDGFDRQGIEESEARRRSVVPNLAYVVEEMIAEGDTVVVRLRQTGTHTGSIEKVPATGEVVDIPAVAIYQVEDGRLRERWFLDDKLKLIETVGYRIEKPGS